ncbi:Crp/Fnr family transcriptional regulator [Dyadobacter endophyticus]|uniref:Cyclic nucleotide-binding protein n=1 Tax=Dyadobacter endophyticus TaxID=1749036 RepID=A0ABQ1Z3R6_9BACT|nr:Crp/Fnr family transcriptional regulator [Dyadobacter endophyticus]GGH48613.1 cyclic nucleotide-binding protein [Dyadobacter endophyticus]
MESNLRQHIEKLVLLTDEEFAFVEKHFIFKKFKKHQFMVQQGEPVPYNYFLLSGLTKLVYTDETTDKQHILAFAMQDWWDNDFQAYYTRTRATLSMECLEDTEALCLSLDDFNALRTGLPKIERFFLEKVIAGFLASQRRILSLMTSSAQQRYEQLAAQHPSLLQRLPKTQLAAYLGVSRETLSRMSF